MARKKRKKSKKSYRLFYIVTCIVFLLGIGVFSRQIYNSIQNWNHPIQMNRQTTQEFIDSIAVEASEIAANHNIYASVLIAQAVLESDSGQSGLSLEPYYNLFGIKGAYQGQSVSLATLEDDGTGTLSEIDDYFRVYPSYYASMLDYAALIRTDIYAAAWKENTTSYQDATAALTGLYATDSSYNLKLNQLIEQYQLTQYD